jgi:hypothetical protein
MSDVLTWTVKALSGSIKVPDIKGLPTQVVAKRK